jgi:hypothetical protein
VVAGQPLVSRGDSGISPQYALLDHKSALVASVVDRFSSGVLGVCYTRFVKRGVDERRQGTPRSEIVLHD